MTYNYCDFIAERFPELTRDESLLVPRRPLRPEGMLLTRAVPYDLVGLLTVAEDKEVGDATSNRRELSDLMRNNLSEYLI